MNEEEVEVPVIDFDMPKEDKEERRLPVEAGGNFNNNYKYVGSMSDEDKLIGTSKTLYTK